MYVSVIRGVVVAISATIGEAASFAIISVLRAISSVISFRRCVGVHHVVFLCCCDVRAVGVPPWG